LAREWGQRRAAHDKMSHSRGHDYQHTPPLVVEGEQKEKRRRRTSKEVKEDEAKAQAEKERLQRLFDAGDTTFTTLGVIDVNMGEKKKGRKKRKTSQSAGKENIDPPSAAVSRKRGRPKIPRQTPSAVDGGEHRPTLLPTSQPSVNLDRWAQ